MTQLLNEEECTTDVQKEVTLMTAATDFLSPRPRAHGFDRAVMRLSLAMMVWADRRSGSSLTAAEHARARATADAIVNREHAWALLAARVR
ncbi:MAG: hypothetical protein Q8M65_10535 [Rhodoglobus sp.]|nr:hypothetical protein [Rhodoglobus sp.]